MSGLQIDKSKSPLAQAQELGQAKIGGQDRKIVTAERKTKQGKEQMVKAETDRVKDKKLFKATLKKTESDGSSWEDIEEDFPHVRLEELLDNLRIDDPEEESKE